MGNDIHSGVSFNPISTGQGRNQPLYESHVTKSGRNRVKSLCFDFFFSTNVGSSVIVTPTSNGFDDITH